MSEPKRCAWVSDDELYRCYHDEEWGKPVYDSEKLFELLCLEGQQAGLSWITVLKKREHYRRVFHQFKPHLVAMMTEQDIEHCMNDCGLIRHRAKLWAIVKNAGAYLNMQRHGEDFADFIWRFVQHQIQVHDVPDIATLPTQSKISLAMSRALKKRGFVFVGDKTCYAFMQAAGLVNDHENQCFCKTSF